MKTKSIYQSKTFWFNLIAGIVALLAAVDANILANFGLSPEQQLFVIQIIGSIVALGNIILRVGNKTVVANPLGRNVLPILLMLMMLGWLSSCKTYNAIKAHSSFTVTRQPATANDTIQVVGKIWGIGDIVQQAIPANSNAAQAWRNANKYCQVEIINTPKTLNDTAGVRVTCHSLKNALETIRPRK